MAVSSGGFFLFRGILAFFRWFSSRFNTISKLQGTWDYECIVVDGMEMPSQNSSGNAHGGECTIRVVNRFFYTKVLVSGARKWQGNSQDGSTTKSTLVNPLEWKSVQGSFIGHDEIMYKYSVLHEPVYGITFLKLIFDKNDELLKPQGNFYYLPSENQGVVKTPYDSIKLKKRLRKFGEIYGEVKFSNHRK